MPTQSKYDREIATIKADVAAMGHLFSKLDDAMDKIGTASANISSILAVHDERIDNAEKLKDDSKNLLSEYENKVSRSKEEIKRMWKRL